MSTLITAVHINVDVAIQYILLRFHSKPFRYQINFKKPKKEREGKTFYGNSGCFKGKGAQKEVDKIPEKAYFTQSDAEQQTSKAVAL